jgi:ubiquinone/menaquinone biosynthesis C-methylase UbiE
MFCRRICIAGVLTELKSFTDPKHLRHQQYKTPDNLNARVNLHVRFRTNPYPWHRWVFDQLLVPAKASLFEIGCGPGFLWAENRERIPSDWSIYLADLSMGMVKTARATFGGDRFAFLAADVQRISMPSSRFDAVIANHMLYHVPDPARAFSEFQRVLKPGGRLYAATNGFHNLIEIWEWVAEALPSRTDIMQSRESVLAFSLENGNQLLSKFFPTVKLNRYPDSLEINEVQPIIDFVASTNINMQVDLSEIELRQCKTFLDEKLSTEKVLKVTKDVGIFVAS